MMSFKDKVVVVSGGASGIGKALVETFLREGALVAALDLSLFPATFDPRILTFGSCDVTNETQISSVLDEIKRRYGKIDIYCSNAGIMFPPDSNSTNNDEVTKHSTQQWNKIWQVNSLSHITALRLLLPDWEQHGIGDGIFVVTASAAGLVTQIGDASYGVTKAAAVSLAEHVAICHPKIQVHCLCPQAVDTPFIDGWVDSTMRNKNSAMTDGVLSPEFVADCTLKAIQNRDEFFIFPHPKVKIYIERKAQNHKRWLKGMQRLKNRLMKSKL